MVHVHIKYKYPCITLDRHKDFITSKNKGIQNYVLNVTDKSKFLDCKQQDKPISLLLKTTLLFLQIIFLLSAEDITGVV